MMSLIVGMLPVWCIVVSLIPASWLSILAVVESRWPIMDLSCVAFVRAIGATSLVVGHALSCRRKSKLSRADVCYLTGTTLLTIFFVGTCIAAVTGISLAPPPLTVSAGGCSLLFCFLDLGRVAIQPNVAPVTRAAVAAALVGSSSLVVAGVSTSARLPAATLASSCFLFANAILLLLLARARTPLATAAAQSCKVFGSFCLLSANAMAFQWPQSSSLPAVSGVLDPVLTTALFHAPNIAASYLTIAIATAAYAAYVL